LKWYLLDSKMRKCFVCLGHFMDFVTFAMDPVVNQAAKLRYFWGGQVGVPLVVRMPIAAQLGFGSQHSQSLEAWFMHVPGLKVVMPATPYDAKGLIKTALRENHGKVDAVARALGISRKGLYLKRQRLGL